MSNYHITTLADKALLVKLQRSMYQPYAYSEVATKQIENATGVVGAGRYNKRLFKGDLTLQATNEQFYLLYREYVKHTVPWLDDGVRMVPNALYLEFANDMRGLIASAKQAAGVLEQKWDAMVAADIQRLGILGNPDDYPSKQEIRNLFNASIQFFPVPTANDFRVAVTDEDKAEMEKAVKEAGDNVAKYLLGEMLDPVKAFVDKLSIPIGEKGHIFRDTLVENLADLTERLPKLNINNDPQVTETIDAIRGVVERYVEKPDMLRESPIERKKARDKMAEVDAKLKSIMGF